MALAQAVGLTDLRARQGRLGSPLWPPRTHPSRRTGIVKDNTLYVQAAAGVVADSIPEREWRETEHKARALIRAAELVEEGF